MIEEHSLVTHMLPSLFPQRQPILLSKWMPHLGLDGGSWAIRLPCFQCWQRLRAPKRVVGSLLACFSTNDTGQRATIAAAP